MHQLVIREARSAGLGGRAPSLAAIDRRRTELWALAVSVVTVTALLASFAPHRLPLLAETASTGGLRITLGALAAIFVAYVFEKEVHLRRLHRLLLDERVLSQAIAERASQLADLSEGAQAVNAVLDLDEVLRRLLDRALQMVEAPSGAVLLTGDRPSLELLAACVRGDGRTEGERVAITDGAVRAAILERLPQLDVPTDSTPARAVVPLVHRDEILGVVEVRGEGDREFSDYEVQILALFADYVSLGIANARLYDTERTRVAELTELDEMKSQFLANVSHELKTPLTSIIGGVSLLRRAPLAPEEQDELYDSIDRQARRLAGMVDQLLHAGRLEDAPAEPGDETSNVERVARMVAADLAVTGRQLTVAIPDECEVRCGTSTLQQVLINLTDNAHKYGAAPVSIEAAPRDTTVVISVIDAGPGVPADQRERVFERFHRVDPSNDRPGMGLGLPIVKRLVEACGGRVWIDDVPGGGTAVRVALPVATPAAAVPPASGSLDRQAPAPDPR